METVNFNELSSVVQAASQAGEAPVVEIDTVYCNTTLWKSETRQRPFHTYKYLKETFGFSLPFICRSWKQRINSFDYGLVDKEFILAFSPSDYEKYKNYRLKVQGSNNQAGPMLIFTEKEWEIDEDHKVLILYHRTLREFDCTVVTDFKQLGKGS